MAWFKKKEDRAEPPEKGSTAESGAAGSQEESRSNVEDSLLRALLGNDALSREDALQISAVQFCLGIVSGAVSGLPIRLYEEKEGKVSEITGDDRLALLNKDTKDTMTSTDFWGAVVEDIYLGKGAFVYLNRSGNRLESIHYVENQYVSLIRSPDPIFKDYDIQVYGKSYAPFEFLKIFRRTKNGCENESIVKTNPVILQVARNTLLYERRLTQKGGNKKGFLESERKLSNDAMDALKGAFRNLYSNNEENVVVLNNGVKFRESSNTSVEMQLNENKRTNAKEIGLLFGFPTAFFDGNPTDKDCENLIKYGIVPVLTIIEAALDRDLLLESEKGTRYFAFDTKELTRASLKERYEAYRIGLDKNFLQTDEVREMEDMEPLGFKWITLGLNQVLYNPETKEIYTPNTNKLVRKNMEGSETDED